MHFSQEQVFIITGASSGIGQPIDVANLSAYLLSDNARWITGQNYILDGGKL